MATTRQKMDFAINLGQTYLTMLPRMAYRTTLSLATDPKGAQRFIHDVLNNHDIANHDSMLGSCSVIDLLPGNPDVVLKGHYQNHVVGGTMNLLELGCLAHVVHQLKAEQVFEFGTFNGRTTRLLALNTPDSATITTLDLPQDQVRHQIGEEYRDTPESRKIKQLHGDSMVFNPAPWENKCDFVWVDANHDYEFVVKDTENALRMCRSGGWIGWHDYRLTAWWSGVTKHVREIRGRFNVIKHILGTTIVLARKA